MRPAAAQAGQSSSLIRKEIHSGHSGHCREGKRRRLRLGPQLVKLLPALSMSTRRNRTGKPHLAPFILVGLVSTMWIVETPCPAYCEKTHDKSGQRS